MNSLRERLAELYNDLSLIFLAIKEGKATHRSAYHKLSEINAEITQLIKNYRERRSGKPWNDNDGLKSRL